MLVQTLKFSPVRVLSGLLLCIGITHAYANTPSTTAPPSHTAWNWCKLLSTRMPGISTEMCSRTQLLPTGALSHNRFPILARDIPALRKSEDESKGPIRVLMLGGIHGDELTSSAIVFEWLQYMHEPLAQSMEWKVAPVVNPDGLLAPKPKRVNAMGVDLNRNFPTPNWDAEASHYWSKTTKKDPRRFPGVSPLSEPETRWVNETIEDYQPQVIIAIHAPFGLLDFDGPAKPPERFGRLWYNRFGVFPGSLGNYSGVHKNIPVITIELPNAQDMPPAAEIHRIWQDMLVWIKKNIREPEEPLLEPSTPLLPAQQEAKMELIP